MSSASRSSSLAGHRAVPSSALSDSADVDIIADPEILSARRGTPDREFTIYDSKCYTKHPTRRRYYISTPNMEIIPQLPLKDSKIRYFEDGMMGLLEFFKWPQEYDPKCPFAFAAPGNSYLTAFPHQSFFTVDIHGVLPTFADEKAPWFHILGEDYEITDVSPIGEYGRLRHSVLQRLEAALLELASMIKAAGKKLADRGVFTEDETLAKDLLRVGVPVWFIRSAVTFAEFTFIQRSVTFVPARLAFSNVNVMRLGRTLKNAPEWAREQDDDPTLTSLMDRLDIMSVSNQALIKETRKYDPTIATLIAQQPVERYDLEAGRPGITVDELPAEHFMNVENVPEAVAVMDKSAREETETWQVAPEVNVNVGQEEGVASGPGHDGNDSEPPVKKARREGVEQDGRPSAFAMGQVASSSSGSTDLAPAAQVYSDGGLSGPSRLPSFRGSGQVVNIVNPHVVHGQTRGSGSQRAQGAKVVRRANRPTTRGTWVPAEVTGWDAALRFCTVLDAPDGRLLYALPSPHLFYQQDVNSDIGCRMLHNWIRIRRWCLRQVVNGASDGQVLMTNAEWRIALEGKYYQIVDIDPSHPQPSSAKQELAKLPLKPEAAVQEDRQVSKKPAAGKQKDGNYKDRYAKDRLAMRADINVRFGVHAGFPPYSEDGRHKWGGEVLSYAQMAGNEGLRSEIVWELALTNFRVEVLHVDRELCPLLYSGPDNGLERSVSVAHVWSRHGWVTPPWQYHQDEDCLSSTKAGVRGRALARFAHLMSRWPPMEPGDEALTVKWAPEPYELSENEASTVLSFYIRAAHSVLGRLPTIPLVLPASIAQRSPVRGSFDELELDGINVIHDIVKDDI
ncbi:hypothetical protein EUX98_g7084 [Antrodiella citrinella]|uniref:Uncharacterized protein n=1 Tax=Antrodiella citrinella TaxID=2447956 RepID=A0A4S4MPF0_9APHY|nr:hypothetical protein EUX98_g7084 [Antrodiella citrinella]